MSVVNVYQFKVYFNESEYEHFNVAAKNEGEAYNNLELYRRERIAIGLRDFFTLEAPKIVMEYVITA